MSKREERENKREERETRKDEREKKPLVFKWSHTHTPKLVTPWSQVVTHPHAQTHRPLVSSVPKWPHTEEREKRNNNYKVMREKRNNKESKYRNKTKTNNMFH